MTCVPATLSTLCRYWKKPADHLTIAEAICYDGTPQHKERGWAESAGYVAREFTLTWEAGRELINRGIPFVLTTTGTERGHAQAIIGYDALRGTFLVRDPYTRGAFEFIADKGLEAFRSSGPRCLLILPREEAGRLAGAALPEAELYDQLHLLQIALEKHDRAAAQGAQEALAAAAPGHRITLYAARCLAGYDANRTGVLAAVEELLKLYPEDANLHMSKLACLRDLARRQDRIDLLRKICDKKGSDAVFWQALAEELLGDAREAGQVIRLIERRMRRTPGAGTAASALARALWERRQFSEAFVLFRIAACQEDKHEGFARNYFSAARHFRKTEEALEFLRERFRRFGALSSAPGRTLYGALSQIDRDAEAFAVLDEALAKRPNDAELLTFAANAHVRHQKIERGLELLKKAEPLAYRLEWLRAAAQIEDLRCRAGEAMAYWRQLTEQDPLWMEAQAAVARLLAETQGRSEAIKHLEALGERFPHHFGIINLLIEWQRTETFVVREGTIRKLIAIDANNAWSHRELAIVLAEGGRDGDAMAAMRQAEVLEPEDERTANVMVTVHELGGRADEARKWARRAISLSVDNQLAMNALMRLCGTTEERRTELKFVQDELIRQVIFGDGLIEFRRAASTVLEPAEVTTRLREAHAARPDLWQAWSALVTQLTGTDVQEAEKLAKQAVERFPLVPVSWVDLSQIYGVKGEVGARIAALEEALAIAPGWGLASRILATVHQARGDIDAAQRCLEQATVREPLDSSNHAYLAEVLWKRGERARAIQRLEHSLLLNPDEQFHWDVLGQWGVAEGKPELALEKVRQLTRLRAGESASWRRLARTVNHEDPEALAAVDEALRLEPRNPDNHDLRALVLAACGRMEEATAACSPAVYEGAVPLMLRARAAWIMGRAGRVEEAIAAMREVVASDQSNLWAWQRLADWLAESRQQQEYLKVCLRMAELWPRQPGVLEYAAHARVENDPKNKEQRKLAMSELRRALEVSPDRVYAARRLFELLVEEMGYSEARQVLRLMKQQGHQAMAWVCEAQLALASSEGQIALPTVRDAATGLFMTVAAEKHQLKEMLDLGQQYPVARSTIHAALGEAALKQGCNDSVPAFAIQMKGAGKDWKGSLKILRGLAKGSAAWRQAAYEYVSETAKAKNPKLIKRIMKEQGEEIRKCALTWGGVGYGLSLCEKWKQVRTWMHDYRRADAEPWMLMNLGLAYSNLKQAAEAGEVHLRALQLKPDHSRGGHLVWLAVYRPEEFTGAGGGKVAYSLENMDERNLHTDEKEVLPVAKLMVILAKLEPRARVERKDIEAAWHELGTRWKPRTQSKIVKRFYRAAFRRVLRRVSHPIVRIQAIARLLSF